MRLVLYLSLVKKGGLIDNLINNKLFEPQMVLST